MKRRKNRNVENRKEEIKITKLKPLTEGQEEYLECIQNTSIILCTGVAGTGKSFCAIGKAVEMLRDSRLGLDKIVLVRPLMECGNRLGALPGDLDDKVGPYMQHFKDMFGDFLNDDDIEDYSEAGILSIEPLELMRGRTFKNTIVILDEAQNCTYQQLVMFLTRFGENSKMIVCGDEKQSDVKDWEKFKGDNAFAYVCDKLDGVDDMISVVELTEDDIVRHQLVRKVIKALQ